MAIGPRSIMHFRIPGRRSSSVPRGVPIRRCLCAPEGRSAYGSTHPVEWALEAPRAMAMERCSLTSAIRPSIAAIATAGKGLQVKEGTNCKQGTATLFSGTVTVANASVTANSRIFLTVQSLSGVSTPQAIAVTSRIAGTSFTIQRASTGDTSIIAYEIFEPG